MAALERGFGLSGRPFLATIRIRERAADQGYGDSLGIKQIAAKLHPSCIAFNLKRGLSATKRTFNPQSNSD